MSTDQFRKTQENSEERKKSLDDEFNRLIASFTIPENMDPVLLEAWLRREKKAFLRKYHLEAEILPPAKPASLPFTYAGYLSVLVMMVAILLGLLNGTESDLILKKAFPIMFLFFGVGFFIGKIIDNSVHESVKEMVREVIHRSENKEVKS